MSIMLYQFILEMHKCCEISGLLLDLFQVDIYICCMQDWSCCESNSRVGQHTNLHLLQER